MILSEFGFEKVGYHHYHHIGVIVPVHVQQTRTVFSTGVKKTKKVSRVFQTSGEFLVETISSVIFYRIKYRSVSYNYAHS